MVRIRNIEVGNIRGWDGREMSTGMQLSKLINYKYLYASKPPRTYLQIILLSVRYLD